MIYSFFSKILIHLFSGFNKKKLAAAANGRFEANERERGGPGHEKREHGQNRLRSRQLLV